jgi:acetyl esterase/lipase
MIRCGSGSDKKHVQEPGHLLICDSIRYIKAVFDSVEVKKNIFFAEVINHKDSLEKLYLDVYQPFGDSIKNRPTILWVHGGGFKNGTKTQSYIRKLAIAFAKKGYVSVSTDYRLRNNPKEDITGTINDAIQDVMRALDWIRENSDEYGIDKDNIIIGGGSAGGKLSAFLCYNDATDSTVWNKNGIIAFINLWGSPDKDLMNKTVDINDPPTIFIHGTADSVVPYSNCQWLSGLVKNAGIKYEVFAIDGAGHTPVDHMQDIVDEITGFLYEILTTK